ncbi:MAG TPA: ABC transporter substrate-binding protein [Candidatus Blautia gallistercoris]|uniref:ABC transporter substrate-binding protein n=1 Tax=Candidatus Blautia gallistercoris TaxID=2838490 RepID=A0A9D1WFJ6_9FIRM|nr:ABC transporter substrate-binding protein [Candidatus Blautia gallistercoris]
MKRKIVAVMLATAMSVTLFGCGGGSSDTASTDAAETEAPAEETEAPAEETEAPAEENEEPAAEEEASTEEASADSSIPDGDPSDTDMTVLEGLRVGFSQCDNMNSWRIAETESIQAAADEYGVELVFADAGADIAKQASDIEDMVAQGVDYIIAAPQEEDGLQTAFKSAMDAGIPVILVDRGINGTAGEDYTIAIMSDFIWEAEQVANKFIEATGGKGNCVILQGTQGATSTNDRQEGFMNAIEGTDIVVVADQVANYTMAEGQSVMENILQAQGDEIDMVFAHNDDMALGAIEAIKAAGYVPGEDILVGGIDGPAAAMEAILAGEQLCSCSCSPLFGPISFETIARLEAGEEVPTEIMNEDTLYDINNADVSLGF